MKNQKTLKIIIILFAIATIINVAAIVYVEGIINAPLSYTQTTVLGAVFSEETPANTIEINLVRPPRTASKPGDTVLQTMTLTNTSDVNLYFRCIYDVYIEDESGNIIDNISDFVTINMNENWVYKDGYWYYTNAIIANEKINCPIKSITYSKNFANHIDYDVYVPLIIESVETCGMNIYDINFWPKNKINNIDYKRLNESASWKTQVTFDLFG